MKLNKSAEFISLSIIIIFLLDSGITANRSLVQTSSKEAKMILGLRTVV